MSALFIASARPAMQEGDASMRLDLARQRFLAAWRVAVHSLPHDVLDQEISSTANAMRGLADLEYQDVVG